MIIGSKAFEAQQRATADRVRARQSRRLDNIRKIKGGDWLSAGDPARVEAWLRRRGLGDGDIARLMTDKHSPPLEMAESFGVAEPQAMERVIGVSDLMGVAFLEQGLAVSHTVGRIWVDVAGGRARGFGTGFMVSPRLLLTNHHVLEDAAIAAASGVQFNYQLGSDGRECPTAMFRLAPDAFFINSQPLDYALVAVAPQSDQGARALSDFGFNKLIAQEGKAIEGQWLNCIQHPSGGFKQLAFRENQLVDIFDSFLHYSTDTAQGSSGSPLYNDRWEVVGLHHSGMPAKDAQGRVLAIDGRVWTSVMGEDRVKWVYNEGIRISRIMADLAQRATSPAQQAFLQELLTMSPGAPKAESTRGGAGGDVPAGSPSGGTGVDGAMGPDGSATWVFPLRVTVQLGGQAPSGAGQPPVAAGTGTPAPTPAQDPVPTVSAPTPFDTALRLAQTALAGREDVRDVRAGYVFKNGWITREPAIVVTVRKRLSPAALRQEGATALPARFGDIPVEVVGPTITDLFAEQIGVGPEEALAAEGLQQEEITYQPPVGASLAKVTANMAVTAVVTPDHGWPILDGFLRGAQRSLVVGMYDFGAKHISAAIKAAARASRGFKFSLAMQGGSSTGSGTKANDLTDEEMVADLETALGSRFENSWIKVGLKNGWVASSYHIKVAVRDRQAFWLSSGNWQSSNQPEADPLNETPQRRTWLNDYNRDWHVVVDHAGLAQMFEAYIRNDFRNNLPGARFEAMSAFDAVAPGAVVAEDFEEAAPAFAYFPPFQDTRQFTVTPLLTPDNYLDALLGLIDGARRELFIQNQTFNAATRTTQDLQKIMSAVLRRQEAGVDVRIIFRIIASPDARRNLEALQDLGFDMKKVKVQKNCHTKGVMVDGKRVMIGSQNLSQLGVTLNRDASLIFEDEPLTAYFRKIFLHDWKSLARQNIGPEHYAAELVSADAPTPEGMERISWKDFMEMA